MNCPKCGHPSTQGELECAGCGIIFAKWESRTSPVAQTTLEPPPEPQHEPTESQPRKKPQLGWHHVVGVVLLLGALHWGYKQLRGGETPPEEPGQASAQEQGSSEQQPSPRPTGYDPARGLSTLDGLLQEIQSTARPYGVTITIDQIKHNFLKGAQVLHPAVMSYEGSELGLPIPDRTRLEGADKDAAGAANARCLVKGQWVHGDRMPSPGQGASECWQRRSFKKNVTVGYPISPEMAQTVTYYGLETVLYERRVWQPHNGRWAPYSEAEEARVMEHLIWNKYGNEAEWEDQEKMHERIAKAQADPNLTNPEWQVMHIQTAILGGYESRLLREGASYRLAYMRSW